MPGSRERNTNTFKLPQLTGSDELKLFQIESWIGMIVKNIFSEEDLPPRNLAAIIHAVRGEYLYTLGYHPTSLNETPVVHYDHPAYLSKPNVEYPKYFPNDTAPVSIISKVINILFLSLL